MMDLLAQLVVWLDTAASLLGHWLLAPIAFLPEWLSATLAGAVSGVVFLAVFKYTSHQRAIKRAKCSIKAHLLSLKLFKDSTAVVLRAQGGLFLGALKLLLLAVVPILVMLLPALLILGQLAVWYQSRPLRVGEEAVVTLQLNRHSNSWPKVHMEPSDAAEVLVGPVRIFSQREICWNIQARAGGYHRLVFRVDGQPIDKDLAIGDGLMRVSPERPGWSCWEALQYPREQPFRPESPVESIKIDYPPRSTWTLFGLAPWVYSWFAVSMIAAFCFRGWLNVAV
jgi:hypothetical protein